MVGILQVQRTIVFEVQNSIDEITHRQEQVDIKVGESDDGMAVINNLSLSLAFIGYNKDLNPAERSTFLDNSLLQHHFNLRLYKPFVIVSLSPRFSDNRFAVWSQVR